MGTRHLIQVILGGKVKVAQYGQFDGQPFSAGLEILNHLKTLDITLLKSGVSRCVFSDEDNKKLAPQTGNYISALVLAIIERSNGCVLEDSSGFEKSPTCAVFYKIDLDADTFCVHVRDDQMKHIASFPISGLPTSNEFLDRFGYTKEFLDSVMVYGWSNAA